MLTEGLRDNCASIAFPVEKNSGIEATIVLRRDHTLTIELPRCSVSVHPSYHVHDRSGAAVQRRDHEPAWCADHCDQNLTNLPPASRGRLFSAGNKLLLLRTVSE
jgi:hypothetical protein